jgi:hypothetical protein
MSVDTRVKKIRLGDDLPVHCGRCKGERIHQVVALNPNGVPATVICRTCRGQHRYHVKGQARSSAATVRKPNGREADASRHAPPKSVRPYVPQETYSEGEWIEHQKFGQGEVTGAREGKIEVRFPSGTRLLLQSI